MTSKLLLSFVALIIGFAGVGCVHESHHDDRHARGHYYESRGGHYGGYGHYGHHDRCD